MASENPSSEPLPWHLGVYDAHCHPTDTMSSIRTIPSMKARVLTVMATRAQDQDLVSSVAESHGVKSSDPSTWSREECIVPCFGWHPWFSHQMYISPSLEKHGFESLTQDQDQDGPPEEPNLVGDDKIKHYQAILQPQRESPSDEEKRIYLSLPDPTPFSTFLRQARAYLSKHPYALVGEIGLDRSYRIPEPWTAADSPQRNDTLTPGGREGRRLTPFRCGPKHQTLIFRLQLQLAAELNRGVSVHGVQAHGLVSQALQGLWRGHEREVLSRRERKKRGQDHASVAAQFDAARSGRANGGGVGTTPYPPRVCLHSYSGSADFFAQYRDPAVPVLMFASFSTAVNLGDDLGAPTPDAFRNVVLGVPDHMLLVESDLHTAGPDMDDRLEDIVRRVCEVKGWGLEHGVRVLAQNWRRFVFGEAEGGVE